MQRRRLLSAPVWLLVSATAWADMPDTPGASGAPPGYRVSAAQLEQAVAARFPLRQPAGGLFELTVQAPRLRLLPERNRLGADMTVEAAGLALGRRYSGLFDLDFALRYEAADRTVRAHRLRVNALRFADLPPGPAELLQAYGPALAEQALGEVVLHRLRRQDLALPDAMGLQPGSITVTDRGLVVGFVPSPLR